MAIKIIEFEQNFFNINMWITWNRSEEVVRRFVATEGIVKISHRKCNFVDNMNCACKIETDWKSVKRRAKFNNGKSWGDYSRGNSANEIVT